MNASTLSTRCAQIQKAKSAVIIRTLNCARNVRSLKQKMESQVIPILKIKKCHKKEDEWIVYNPDNFKHHTHCRSRRVAIAIKNNVERQRLPKSRNLHTLYSHLRLTGNNRYRQQLAGIIEETKQKKHKLSTELYTECGQIKNRKETENVRQNHRSN